MDRHFTEDSRGDGLIRFHFPPGQECFRGPHYLPVDRDPSFINLSHGRGARIMDYDEFQTTMNEVVVQNQQRHLEV